MKITISGLPGSGTTTAGRLLADSLGIEFYSAGDIFRKMAKEHNMTLEQFSLFAQRNEDVDRKIDSTQREIASKIDKGVIEGRLSGWMIEDATMKVWLFARDSIRYQRISEREKKPVGEIMRLTRKRELSEMERYQKYYGIDINDLSIYDLAINSGKLPPEKVVDIITCALKVMDDERK